MTQIPSNRRSKDDQRDRKLLMAEQEWHNFNLRFPDEEACVRELHKRNTGGAEVICHKCGSDKTSNVNERCFRCLTCHKRSWFTAGTPFVKFKKLKPWLFAQSLRQKGISLNGSQLAELLMISKATGAYITKRVAFLTDKMTGENGIAKLPSALNTHNLVQFSENRANRNQLKVERRQTFQQNESAPNQDEQIPVQSAIKAEQSRLQSENAKEKENILYAALSNKPQDFDFLQAKVGFNHPEMSATLIVLELNGLATRLPGDLYIRTGKVSEKTKDRSNRSKKSIASDKPKFIRIPTLASMVNSLKSIWKGISEVIVNELHQLRSGAK